MSNTSAAIPSSGNIPEAVQSGTSVIFFGSGPVAAESLRLLAQHCHIAGVITKPRPAHHAGDFPVLRLAEKMGVPTFTPANKAELSALFAPGLPVPGVRAGVVIDYGIIIGQDVIDSFEMGILNSHFSLLPEWRGADPITFAILSGQAQTGVSLMLITAGLDEGPLVAQADYPIPAGITTPQLTEQLIDLSDQQLRAMLPLYLSGQAIPLSQAAVRPDVEPTYSRKLSKNDGLLDFAKPAAQLEREVRAFAGWPQSRTRIGDTPVIVTAAHIETGSGEPGRLWRGGKNRLGFYTARDILEIDRLKPDSKPVMTAAAYLAGHSV